MRLDQAHKELLPEQLLAELCFQSSSYSSVPLAVLIACRTPDRVQRCLRRQLPCVGAAAAWPRIAPPGFTACWNCTSQPRWARCAFLELELEHHEQPHAAGDMVALILPGE